MSKIYSFEKKEYIINNFKFTLDWEGEVLTEYKTFNYIYNSSRELPLDYLAFPWALLLDLFSIRFKNFFPSFYSFIKNLNLLENLPLNNKYITTIQSYHYKKYLSCFQKIGIKYIFCPHITKNIFLDIFFNYDLIILPYIIYPTVSNLEKINYDKTLLYNFIGNIKYSLERPTFIRSNIVKMNHPENTIVKGYNKWHFDDKVYGEQLKLIKNKNHDISNKEKEEREKYYRDIMNKSLFSICPLGIGPNSIRLWESFTYGSIPVSISNNLWLPFYIDIEWDKLLVDIKEEDFLDLQNINNIDKQEINNYQTNGLKFCNNFLIDKNFGNIVEKAFDFKKKFTLLIPWYNILDELRYKEIHTCLGMNLNNEYIEKIVLFYEVVDTKDINFDKYNNSKIEIIPIVTNKKRDVTFNRLVDYANQNCINEYCIISNNDIYFDTTLNKIESLNFELYDYFLALTRKNCDDYLDNNNSVWKPHSASQDTWIFKSPIKKMKYEINLGWIQCDNIIAECYNSLGYNVVNPHYDINCWHLHKYNNTSNLLENYNYNYRYATKKIPLQTINSIKNNKLEKEDETNKNWKVNFSKLSKIKRNWLKNS